ncbi:DinB family protein [Streptomyces sp. ODS28]|uniref:DinB family protein n=1 Tax=Streptomyces sp. ODS28 TaxID=3136688 RepID=UPI0031EE24BB
MPTFVAAEKTGDERGALLAFLEAQRGGIRRSVHGLTEEQARSTPSASTLSLSALLKHVAVVEENWLRTALEQPAELTEADMQRFQDSFVPHEDETVQALLDRHAAAAAAVDEAVRAQPSLDDTFRTPKAPWGEADRRSWRWLVLHLVEEIARHAGHADIIRETVDGKGAFDLVFETGAAKAPDAWDTGESAGA